jgi:hypothetical protein
MGACIAFCLVLALDLTPMLRGDFGWRWPYEAPDAARLLPLLVVVSAYVMVGLRLRRGVVLWSFAGAVIVPLAALFLLGDPLFLLATRTFSGLATGAHMAGVSLADMGQALRDWPALMPTFMDPDQHIMASVHIALSPPGLPLLFHEVMRLLEAIPPLADAADMALRPLQCHNLAIMAYDNAQLGSAWIGILMPVWAAFAVLLLYRLGGRLAALWWPLVPSVALFTPNWNTAYPVLALVAFWLLDRALRHGASRRATALLAVASGAAVSLLTFLNISTVPLIGLIGLYALLTTWDRAGRLTVRSLVPAVRVGLWFGAGLITVWGIYFIATGVTPLAILEIALGQHLELERPYLPWVFLHVYDLLLFTGLPLALIALLAITQRPRSPLTVALALTIAIMAVSGTARGETGRVWMFFSPFILIVAARALQPPDSSEEVPIPRGAGMVALTQALVLVTLVAFLRVIATELTPPPSPPPDDQTPLQAPAAPPTLGGYFTLIGWHAEPASDGTSIDLTLRWRAEARSAVPYFFSALIVGPDGQPTADAVDWQPFDTDLDVPQYPVTCWVPGQTVMETRRLPLGQSTPGEYWISLSAFDIRDMQRLSVTVPGAPEDTQIGLGPVRVQ